MHKNLLLKIFELSRIIKINIQIFTDSILIIASFLLSMIIRLNDLNIITNVDNWNILLILIPTTILINFICGFYQSIIRFVSDRFFLTACSSIFLSSLILYLISQIFDYFLPRSIPFIYFNFLFIFTISTRYLFKYIFFNFNFQFREPVAIYGAGENGRRLLNSLRESFEYNPIMFIDDNRRLSNKKINGVKVLHFEASLKEIKKHKVDLVLLAMPNILKTERKKILDKLDKCNLAVKSIPNVKNFMNINNEIANVTNISIQDILERKEVPPKYNLMKKNISNKCVLITGCGGSIGSELCKQILEISPKKLLILDNSEFGLYKINNKIHNLILEKKVEIELFPILGSVQDEKFIEALFKRFKIETVYHAAAYKHVPLVEKNIIEGIKNNIFGTFILSEVAVKNNVESFILISSDKAVRPTNYMGATKRFSELICQALSIDQKNTIFSIVRFGNVIGSSGSVVPLFAKQIEEGGPVTLTHNNITRYFMSIKEAVELVIQAGAMAKNGDLFVLDMGKPKKILNLAKKMIRLYGKKPIIDKAETGQISESNSVQIKITGLRPGEKIHEELLLDNKIYNTEHSKIFRAREESINKKKLILLLDKLRENCINHDLKNIKKTLEEAPLSFNTSNNFSDLNYDK